ncbi:MAG: amidophosphoribosyltransferase, partial [Mycobacterium sp.]|nr:amidophosphoribosyltransferase [Mycobacterium sp.]
ISLRGLIAATEQPTSRLCSACFDGKYPIELPSETALGKNVIEQMLSNAARGATQADIVARGISPEAEQATALRHP